MRYRITGDIDNGWTIEEWSNPVWVEIHREDGLLEAALWLEQIVEYPKDYD
jgi:hypothetical protein